MRIRDWSSDGVLFRSLDEYSDIYETKVGPRNGAKVVARAWTDPEFLAWLRRDASAAIKSFGFEGRQGEHMVVVDNTDRVHNVVVCTLRSEEHTSELQSLMRISYAVFCLNHTIGPIQVNGNATTSTRPFLKSFQYDRSD